VTRVAAAETEVEIAVWEMGATSEESTEASVEEEEGEEETGGVFAVDVEGRVEEMRVGWWEEVTRVAAAETEVEIAVWEMGTGEVRVVRREGPARRVEVQTVPRRRLTR
jgi:hypothetical protein